MKKKRFLNALLQGVEIGTAYILGDWIAWKFFSGTFWQTVGITMVFITIFCGMENLVRRAIGKLRASD